jgi:hypothetical protein
MALIIHSASNEAIALRLAEALSAWDISAMPPQGEAPAERPSLIMPLLDDKLLEHWEAAPLGEWAMEALEDEEVRLLPVLIEDCDWNESLFFGLPLLPHARVPIQNPRFWTEEQALQQVLTDLQKEFLPPEVTRKGGFKRAAFRLVWHTIPIQWKWIAGIILAGLLGFILF